MKTVELEFSNSLIIRQVKLFFFSVYFLVLKKYQTLETVFHGLSKHLEFRPIEVWELNF